MDTYLVKLRQNIFQVTLLSASIFGLSLAYLMNKSALFSLEEEAPLGGAVSVPQQAQALSKASIPERSEFEALAAGNLFRGTVVALDGEGGDGQFSIEGLTLLGIIAGSPRYASASILLKGEKSANAYFIGDTVNNGRVFAIHDTSVIFENASGSRFTLSIEDSLRGSGIQEVEDSRPKSSPKGAKVEKIVLNRDRFKRLIKDQADLFRLKFAPAIEGGKIKGWRLLKVPGDHFLHSMGARSGDIIRRYNGQELENQERMIQMWQSLQSANQVSVDIDRRGKLITYDISIK